MGRVADFHQQPGALRFQQLSNESSKAPPRLRLGDSRASILSPWVRDDGGRRFNWTPKRDYRLCRSIRILAGFEAGPFARGMSRRMGLYQANSGCLRQIFGGLEIQAAGVAHGRRSATSSALRRRRSPCSAPRRPGRTAPATCPCRAAKDRRGRTACARSARSCRRRCPRGRPGIFSPAATSILPLYCCHQRQPARVARVFAAAPVVGVEIGLLLHQLGVGREVRAHEDSRPSCAPASRSSGPAPGWRSRWSGCRPPARCWRSRRCCRPS